MVEGVRKEALHRIVNRTWSQGCCRRVNYKRGSFCVSKDIESFLHIIGNNTPMHASHTHRDHLFVAERDTSPPSPPLPTPATGAGNGARHTTLRTAAPARQPLLHYDDDGAHSTMASWSSGRWVLISIRQHTNSTCGNQIGTVAMATNGDHAGGRWWAEAHSTDGCAWGLGLTAPDRDGQALCVTTATTAFF